MTLLAPLFVLHCLASDTAAETFRAHHTQVGLGARLTDTVLPVTGWLAVGIRMMTSGQVPATRWHRYGVSGSRSPSGSGLTLNKLDEWRTLLTSGQLPTDDRYVGYCLPLTVFTRHP